jgi:protein SCO1/2
VKKKETSTTVRFATIFTTAIIILGTYFLLTTPSSDKKKYEEKKQEEKIDIGGDFSLINLKGEQENTKLYSGKYKLVYFGFSYCPDICPTALSLISETLKILEKYGIDIVPIFVTIDPERDTKEVLGPYLSHFHPKIIGYTGSSEEIKKAADLYKVYYAKVPRNDAGPNDYLVDHSSFIYFMSPDTKYIKHFPSSSSPENIANFIHQSAKSVN